MNRNLLYPLVALLTIQVNAQDLPLGSSDLFTGSGMCATCHAVGGPNTGALKDANGIDVSPVNLWRGTMMANSAKDPFWQAKVAAEVQTNPHVAAIIEDKCTTCHTPAGRTEAHYHGADFYSLDEAVTDPLAMDGVTCSVCHQIQDQDLGTMESFSGHYTITADREIFGPFLNPVTGPMQNMVNFTPTYSEHILSSEHCGTCHTLFTPYLDDEGEIAGEAPEQTPYLEWLNSAYPDQNVQCQTCHMPISNSSIVISNRPPWLNPRAPFGEHDFVGGNVYALRILKSYSDELGVSASQTVLDSTINRTRNMLRTQTAQLAVSHAWQNESLSLDVGVTNLTGHKFPTAYPSRRAWLEVLVQTSQGGTSFHSGGWSPESGELVGQQTLDFEPHHDMISSPQEVQIFQAIPADINGAKTYTLLRIASYLKDNRLLPQGYTSDGPWSDTTAVRGLALEDPDFNTSPNGEGTGADITHYQIGGLDQNESYSVTLRLWYQSMTPEFLGDLLAYDIPETEALSIMVNAVPNLPELVDSVHVDISATGISPDSQPQLPDLLALRSYPNPFNPETRIHYHLPVAADVNLRIFDVNGRMVFENREIGHLAGDTQITWNARRSDGSTLNAGVYFCHLSTNYAQSMLKLVLVN